MIALQGQLEKREQEIAAMMEHIKTLEDQISNTICVGSVLSSKNTAAQGVQPTAHEASNGMQTSLDFIGGNNPYLPGMQDFTNKGMNPMLMAMIDDMVRKQVRKAREKDDESF